MRNRYLAKLTPAGKYYFGSENTFDSEDKASGLAGTNYLVRSRQYPQQTTLLGMMRYAILQQYDLLGKDKSNWPDMIGACSFKGNVPDYNGKTTQTWGLIESISPLFIMHNGNKYLPAGLTTQLYTKESASEYTETELTATERTNTCSNYGTDKFYLFDGYDAKQYSKVIWKSTDPDALLNPVDVFVESFQVGITKSRDGNSDNNAFYKEYFYQLNPGYSFGFYVETNQPLKNFDEPFIIQSGGDQSLFQLHLTPATDNIFVTNEPTGQGKFILLSDTWCNADDVLPLCYACITQSVDFRYIQTKTTTKRYHNVSKSDADMQKSGKMNLLERGSVLFTGNAAALKAVLNADTAQPYINAGFNYYSFQAINY